MYYEIQSARIRRKKILINITPLIDVLFLLLIFFIVSSTFLEQPSVSVELPSAKTATAARIEQYVITVSAEGSVFINDVSCEASQLATELKKIYQRTVEAKVVLKADERAPYGTIIQVIDAVRQSGLRRIMALTKIAESL